MNFLFNFFPDADVFHHVMVLAHLALSTADMSVQDFTYGSFNSVEHLVV